MVDFYLTKIRKNEENRITEVILQVRNEPITGEKTVQNTKIRVPAKFLRVLLELEKIKVKTATYNKIKGVWDPGDEVVPYSNFLTTKGNEKEEDNLGELPKF